MARSDSSSRPKIDGLVVAEMEVTQLLQIGRMCLTELAFRSKVTQDGDSDALARFRIHAFPGWLCSWKTDETDEGIPTGKPVLTHFGFAYEALRGRNDWPTRSGS